MTWKPTPEVKALHNQAFGWLKQFSVGNLVEPHAGVEYPKFAIELDIRNGRLVAKHPDGLTQILGVYHD